MKLPPKWDKKVKLSLLGSKRVYLTLLGGRELGIMEGKPGKVDTSFHWKPIIHPLPPFIHFITLDKTLDMKLT